MVDTSQAVHSHFSYARGGVLRGVSDGFEEALPARPELSVDVELADGAGSADAESVRLRPRRRDGARREAGGAFRAEARRERLDAELVPDDRV